MKRLIALLLLVCTLSFSLAGCNSDPTKDGSDLEDDKSKTDSANDIKFEEVSNVDRLFESMSTSNFYDVTDFSIGQPNGFLSKGTPTVLFSYMPFEFRPWDAGNPYPHDVARFSELCIDIDHTYEILESLIYIRPIRTLKPDSNKSITVLSSFSKKYGASYSFGFIHNEKRDAQGFSVSEDQTTYDFLISSLTPNDTYYLLDKNTLTMYEVAAESLSFLNEASENWFSDYIYNYHIGIVDTIEISIKGGTDVGVRDVKSVVLEHLNTDQNGTTLRPLEAVEAGPNAILHVTARYNGESKEITDIPKYRKFYRGILLCALREVELNEKLQNQLKVTAPDMTMKIHLECDDWNKTLEYRFFADDSVLLNGIYVGKLTDGHLNVLIDAVGLMLSPNPNDTIDFWE